MPAPRDPLQELLDLQERMNRLFDETLTRERLAPQGQWAAMKAHLTEDERAAVPPDVQITGVSPLAVPGLDAQRCLVWMRPEAGA